MRYSLESLSAALILLIAASSEAQTPVPSAPPTPTVETSPPPAPTALPAPAVASVPVEPAAAAAPPKTRLELQLDNGSSIRFGVLTQLQYEAFGTFTDHPSESVSENIYLRRTMLLIAGTVLHDFDYFVDTDFADLFKAAGDDSLKNGPGISVKDFFSTYKGLGEALMIDGGLMLPPLSRNSLQGAPFLHGLDFYSSTYVHAGVFGSSANSFARDVGLQARGILPGGRLEYRLGVFQGRRRAPSAEHVAATNGIRLAGRLQLNLLDPEKVYFLRGTWLGEKRLLSVAGSYDFQYSPTDSYFAYSFDALLDADNVTAQVEFLYRDGGARVDLPVQRALIAEAGYRMPVIHLSPIVRVERRAGPDAYVDETLIGGGLSLFAFGHNSNLKVFYIRGLRDEGPGYDQFKAQWQVFYF
ncbi:MAG TPA: hypothetical protein VMG12_42250 [Polyangiaceae bacterium]|nr:hypothetical protein [Polyangiaceae bacterium]